MTAKAKPRHLESTFQKNLIRWFRYQYPDLVLFAIPNGGLRNAITAAILKSEGVVAGVPDLLLAYPRGQWAGLFLELKIHPNKPSDNQVAIMAKLVEAGYCCQVAYELDTAKAIIEDYLSLPASSDYYAQLHDPAHILP